jgi:asparagine synthase (glutamine-hydrolysing)
MCGIVGIYDLWGRHRVERELLLSMADTLRHRGPDDSGLYMEGNLGLGFRRLSIIDLATGNQPIYNEDRSIISICNGEIYNYRELRGFLQSKGHRFYTSSDVEVLVHLYEESGTDLLARLNGQFAFAIFDKENGKLFLARDHVGIAPLFYSFTKDIFIFASEMKAILKHPLVDFEIDLTALDQMFSFPGIPSPRTICSNIRSLKPGHYIVVENGRVEIKGYWDLDYPLASELDYGKPESYYVERLDELLAKAVKYRLQADVPVGFYLSGGLDSSLIATMIQSVHPQDGMNSFSIGFNDGEIDERRYQRLVSDRVGSIHHEIVFDWQDISRRLNRTIYHAECPLKESYDTCSLALSELVREHGIKVVLTGEGADELFAGYVGYRFDRQRQELGEDLLDAEMMMERELRERMWGDPNLLYERDQYEFRETKLAIYSEELGSRLAEFDSVNDRMVDRDKLHGRHPIHKRSYLDFKLRLSDHLLADHGDRVAYANSVEARYPFLDIDVIEFAKTIPPDLLLNEAVEKYILRRVAGRYLPDQVINREKFAFVAPGSPYLLRQDIEWMEEILSYEKIRREGYFNPETIERLKKIYKDEDFSLSQTFDNDLLMIVLTFEIVLDLFEQGGQS